jgi:hypothetical protein
MTMTEKCTDMRYPDSQSDGPMSNQFRLVTGVGGNDDSSDAANYPAPA